MSNILRFTIFFLILVTATVHVVLALPTGILAFYLNAAGFYVLAFAYISPVQYFNRKHVVLVLYGYTIVTLVLWVILGDRSLVAYLDKVVELLIIGLLWVEQRLA